MFEKIEFSTNNDFKNLCFNNTLHIHPQFLYKNFGGPTCTSERTGWTKNEWYFKSSIGYISVADSGTKVQVYASSLTALQEFDRWITSKKLTGN